MATTTGSTQAPEVLAHTHHEHKARQREIPPGRNHHTREIQVITPERVSWLLAIVEAVREVLAQGRSATLTVRGDSMIPTLQDGNRVRIISADPSKLQSRELVAYVDAGNQIITHRVVRVEETVVITRGDNRSQDDPPVPFERVLGKARLL